MGSLLKQTAGAILREPNRYSIRLFSASSGLYKSLQQWYRDLWTPERTNLPPYNHFTQIGDPLLRTKAALVPDEHIKSKEVELIVERMINVLHKYDCVGVAAPQIGVSLRIIVMEFKEEIKKKYSQPIYEGRRMSTLPLTVVINPIMEVTDFTKHKHPEGCMSVRGYAAEVERFESVRLRGCNRWGEALDVTLNGWNARIAQHEMDHLDGTLYTDKMDRSTFACTCWEAVNAKSGRVEIPFYK